MFHSLARDTGNSKPSANEIIKIHDAFSYAEFFNFELLWKSIHI